MDEHKKSVARVCLEGAEGNTMTLQQIVRTLMRQSTSVARLQRITYLMVKASSCQCTRSMFQ
jgi:hypothetical protein